MNNVLIMAGGQSSRMRNSTGKTLHKALATVFDIPLVELNLLNAYLHGCSKIWISVSVNELDLIDYLKILKSNYEEKLGLQIRMIIEKEPLGTIGAVQFVECDENPLLVLFVDNLSNLNLQNLVTSHSNAVADMTVACHNEPFKIPFGELVVENGMVVNYIEKPDHNILISSGTYVLGKKAQNLIQSDYLDKRIDVHTFTQTLITQNKLVSSYFHNAIWMDINDQATLLRTQKLQPWSQIEQIKQLKYNLA